MLTIAYRNPAPLLVGALLMACDAGGAQKAADASSAAVVVAAEERTAASETAIAEETLRAMEAFRATVAGPLPDRLSGAAPSMDALVARFAAALEAADTAALITMTMSRGEFITLHYPESVYARPPYELMPDDVWFLARAETEKGLTRLLRRFGGRPFEFVGYDCPQPPRLQGPNRWWSGCTITRAAGGEHAMRYFATIWERGGEFKFGGYANDL